MLKVGLTGSIAVGKTYVCKIFKELGCYVLDADDTARQVVKPNTKGWKLIVENFGEDILLSSKEIDRKKLGKIVFKDKVKREVLNSIVHPLVKEEQVNWLQKKEQHDPNGIAIIDAALMIESRGYKMFEKIIVVYCDFDIQLKRLMKRNQLSMADSVSRIKAQMAQEEKKKYADFVINTSNGFEAAENQTKEVYKELKKFLK